MMDTSRSPYMIRASVRGMGVADMTSTWGGSIPPCSDLFSQSGSLGHAKAVLLIGYDQGQSSELYLGEIRA